MSKKIKFQDLSISNFDQKPDMEGIKGGGWFVKGDKICYMYTTWTYIPSLKVWRDYLDISCYKKPSNPRDWL